MHMFAAHPSTTSNEPVNGSGETAESRSNPSFSSHVNLARRDASKTPSLPPFETGWPSPNCSTVAARRILEGATDLLRQGEILLNALSERAYTENVPLVFNASIGGHYRHCLDHFTNVLRDWEIGLIDYDHRERDRRLETDRNFALHQTRTVRLDLERFDPNRLDDPVSTRCEVSYRPGDAPVAQSTVGRELVYAIAHAIHPYALISVMSRLMNEPLPPDFGVAPSTVDHRDAPR